MKPCYLTIDLKSFYASVECRERGLDPLTTHLVVADRSRTEKTICLAVSPSLKACGLPGRARLFEVEEKCREINASRRAACGGCVTGSSADAEALRRESGLLLEYITAVPRMSLYIEYSTRIYRIYLRSIAPEDIHVYSVDEVMIDAAPYLALYHITARELARRLIAAVQEETGIPATAGIAPNLYLCKAAMDIVAKHMPADSDGVRIAELSEEEYRRRLWTHTPITDFWRVGRGYARKLRQYGMLTMGDVARCSVQDEALLYRLFGKNAELLIDHAWGRESCGMKEIKAFRPASNSLGSGQILMRPYRHEEGAVVLREMAEALALSLVSRQLLSDRIELSVGYDAESLTDPACRERYRGPVVSDCYGKQVPAPVHGSASLGGHTASSRRIVESALALYEKLTDPCLLLRRFTVAAMHLKGEAAADREESFAQLDLFADMGLSLPGARDAGESQGAKEAEALEQEREKRMQGTMLAIRQKYGKNAILKGTDLQEEATAMERNRQIGGHRA